MKNIRSIAIVAVVFVTTGATVIAQPAANQRGGSVLKGHNSNAPIDWEADRIEVQDRSNRVILSGRVVARQDEMTLTSNRVTASYVRNNNGIDVQRIDALGNVIVRSGSQRLSSDFAIYDLDRKLITMTGNVSLVQEGSNVRGGRLVLDLNDGRATMIGGIDGSPSRTIDGRVTGRFSVPRGRGEQR